MYEEGLQARKATIKSLYKIFYLAIFRYGFFVVIIIGAIYISQKITENQTTNILTVSSYDVNEKELTIKTFKKQIDNIQTTGNLSVFVGLGILNRDKDILSSSNNLIKYKDFVLPRYFSADISIFQLTDFSKEEMDSFFPKFFTAKNSNNGETINKNILTIESSIKDTFNLQCLFQTKIYNGLCDTFTNNFVDTFLLYDISKDIEGFKDVFLNLSEKNIKYKEKLCTDLIYHSYYTNNASNGLKDIIKLCGSEKLDVFNKFSLFSDIQKELETKTISKTIYKDNIVTAYKINSFIQILYEDINNRRISIPRLNNYFDVLEELLKSSDLGKFEKSTIYYFNNYILKGTLENPELSIKIGNKGDISNLLKRINTINNGNVLIGYKGLQQDINDNLLVKNNENEENNGNGESNESTINVLLNQIPNFIIKDTLLSGNQVLCEGILTLKDTNDIETAKIGIKFFLELENRVLFVKKIEIIDEKEITETINKILTTQKRSLGDLQSYLNNNISIFIGDKEAENSDNVFCDKMKNSITNTATIEVCNETSLILSKEVKGKTIKIGINYENYIFRGINVSDEESKTLISKFFKQPYIINNYQKIDAQNMAAFINDLLKTFDSGQIENDENQEYVGGENTIIVIEAIEKYLKTKVNDIIEKDKIATATFTIEGITFIGNYNISTHTIEQLYFKFGNEEEPSWISNVSLVLEDGNDTEIKSFVKNPLEFIKNKSPQSYLFYIQRQNQK